MRQILAIAIVTMVFSSFTGCGGPEVRRCGSVVGLRNEKVAEYKALQKAVPPEVEELYKESNFRNYSIYVRQLDNGKFYLFSYYEYVGDDYAADLEKLSANPKMREWFKTTDPCQVPIDPQVRGDWWTEMEEIYHLE
ncbi:MAG TPA: L-rhamnose mutarotase [Candidatus Brocadiia bacterium]|nr:L-rhamnose mutarotase [Candidatus Brocadiia bacterium]